MDPSASNGHSSNGHPLGGHHANGHHANGHHANGHPGFPVHGNELEKDASELQRALSDLMRVCQCRDRRNVGFRDISVTQANALASLVRMGTITLGELATDLFLDKSTSSRVVDSLVRKGYATRTVDPSDARVRRLAVTGRGRELHAGIRRDQVKAQMELIAGLDPDSRREATGLIDRLARAAAECFTRPAQS